MRKAAFLSLLIAAAFAGQVADAQQSASVKADGIVKAGETVNFTVTLEPAPNFNGGSVQISINAPDGRGVGMAFGADAGKKTVQGSYVIPETAPGGRYEIVIAAFFDGFESRPLQAEKISFEVIPSPNLVRPNSAALALNPSQVQFLRQSAVKVQDQIQALKASVAELDQSANGNRVADVLKRNLQDAMKAVASTRATFHQLAGANANPDVEAVFFGDISASYAEILSQLNSHTIKSELASVGTTSVSFVQSSERKPQAPYPVSAQAAFRAFEQNELAYSVAADAQSLTFDLTVNSNPEGATVSYHRRGETDHQNPDRTNTIIKSLPYAIWTIQVQKPG